MTSVSDTALEVQEPVVDEPAVNKTPAGGLSGAAAWEIALAWGEQLRGCVRLETDVERRGLYLSDSFEWVTFVLNGSLSGGFKDVEDANETATAARAATIAWYALSCCPGYSTTENPRFWRRVFTELYYPEYPKSGIVWLKGQPDRPQRPITEATPFFPSPNKPFPRVRIVPKPGEEKECLTALLGISAEADTNSHAEKLGQLLAQLKPFILPSRLCDRTIPVAIEDEAAIFALDDVQGTALSRNVADGTSSSLQVRLRLVSIFVTAPPLRSLRQVSETLVKNDVYVVIPQCDISRQVRPQDPHLSWLFVQDACDRFRISTLDLHPSPANTASPFPMVFSAMPRGQSVTAVRFAHSSQQMEQLSASDWTWLGYAVFHPDSARVSSFTDLELQVTESATDKIKIFANMAKGNNLRLDSGVTTSFTNTTYQLAKVRAGTAAFADPRDGAVVLRSFSSEGVITLCTIADSTSLGEWVRAVIPGVGLGWIRSHSIIEIKSQPAGPSCLKALRLSVRSASDSQITAMMFFLSVVGEGLRHLDLHSSKLMDAERVQAILRLCPSLVSLRVGHNGECWADKMAISQTPRLPRLQQLELRTNGTGHDSSLKLKILSSEHLDDLRALRVVTLSHDDFASNRKAFLDILVRYPRLHFVHHTNGNAPKLSWEFRSYEERRAEMLALLGRVRRGIHDVSQGPMRLDCRLAFLSVIHRLGRADKPRWSSLQHFGPDIVRNILSFSTSPVERDLFVDQGPPALNYTWR